jgi:hypothetical protein
MYWKIPPSFPQRREGEYQPISSGGKNMKREREKVANFKEKEKKGDRKERRKEKEKERKWEVKE